MTLFFQVWCVFQASGNLEISSLVAEEFSDSDGSRSLCLREELFPSDSSNSFKKRFLFCPQNILWQYIPANN